MAKGPKFPRSQMGSPLPCRTGPLWPASPKPEGSPRSGPLPPLGPSWGPPPAASPSLHPASPASLVFMPEPQHPVTPLMCPLSNQLLRAGVTAPRRSLLPGPGLNKGGPEPGAQGQSRALGEARRHSVAPRMTFHRLPLVPVPGFGKAVGVKAAPGPRARMPSAWSAHIGERPGPTAGQMCVSVCGAGAGGSLGSKHLGSLGATTQLCPEHPFQGSWSHRRTGRGARDRKSAQGWGGAAPRAELLGVRAADVSESFRGHTGMRPAPSSEILLSSAA